MSFLTVSIQVFYVYLSSLKCLQPLNNFSLCIYGPALHMTKTILDESLSFYLLLSSPLTYPVYFHFYLVV